VSTDFMKSVTPNLSSETSLQGVSLSANAEHVLRTARDLPDNPSTFDEVMANPDFRTGVAFLVGVKEPNKTVRVNITLTDHELREIDQRARARGLTRSAFLVQSGLKTAYGRSDSVSATRGDRCTARCSPSSA
jgi:hypothetical protein